MGRPTVLLHVDDVDDGCLELSRSSFERALPDVDVLVRDDPDEALVTLAVEPVDAVVSDAIELPDGTPFVEAARNAYPDLPIVLYTGQEFTDAAPVIARAGVTEYVQRRADTTMSDLLSRVERIVSATESRPNAERFRYTPSDDDAPAAPADSSTTAGSGAHDDDAIGDEWTELARCDPTSVDDLVVTLVEVLGDRADERPLVDLFDAEALAQLFASPDTGAEVEVRIQVDTHEVLVTGAGVVATRSLTSA